MIWRVLFFLLTEAVVVSLTKRAIKKQEDKNVSITVTSEKAEGISLHRRLTWLSNML